MSVSPSRVAEPVSVGVPLPRGAVTSVDELSLTDAEQRPLPLQVHALDTWSDGSLRWVLVDTQLSSREGLTEAVLCTGHGGVKPTGAGVRVSRDPDLSVDTGVIVVRFALGGAFPFETIAAPDGARRAGARLSVHIEGAPRRVDLRAAVVTVEGPLRVAVAIAGAIDAPQPLEVSGTVEFFAGSALTRLAVTVRNPRPALHPGGQWGLGDGGSVLLGSIALAIAPAAPCTAASAAVEFGEPVAPVALPFVLHQESSGGEHWNSPVHKTRGGVVDLRYSGYRVLAGGRERLGARATPVVQVTGASGSIAVAVPRFWQNFPAAIRLDDHGIGIEFLPSDSASPHELQGGEQKTFRAVVAFGDDGISAEPLVWVHEPQLVFPAPEWCAASGAVPFLVPAAEDPSAAYRDLAGLALDPAVGFVAKREHADEFGWRHFGDLPADHESAFRPAGASFVSHYNNQYDAIAGFALHFLRTGDRRWWELMDDLARHVRDIDIYHTTGDKAAYSGGLFWHTAHYLDAGTSTHRTYPVGSPVGGGPSSEHNYNLGLMLHWFLTGDPASREAAIGLGRWVIDMDDGRRTVFRWLATGPTGHASFTNDFYGPGRGAGHSILASIVAHRLSGDTAYLAKATEIIGRTVHPRDDIDAHDLLDAERRWSYTAFLQAVGAYLHHRLEYDHVDETFAYAQESLLHYARWMCRHERPSLDRPEALEYPTETWAAQDVRKGDVLLWAAQFGPAVERQLFLDAARRFYDDAFTTVARMPTRHFTRPVVLLLSHGIRHGWLLMHPDGGASLRPATGESFDVARAPKRVFVPQRRRAVARAKGIVAGAAIVAAALLGFVLLR